MEQYFGKQGLHVPIGQGAKTPHHPHAVALPRCYYQLLFCSTGRWDGYDSVITSAK